MRTEQFCTYLAKLVPVLFLVASCGGGGGGIAGIDGSGSRPESVGASVDGFGSIIINNETYNTDTAEFVVSGVSGGVEQQSDLAEGQFVTLFTDKDAETPTASQVFYFPNVTGPVSFVDPISERIVILGRSVVVTADTQFGDNFPGEKSFSGIQVGMTLTISGNERQADSVVATYVNTVQQTTIDISGSIENLDADVKTFDIGQQQISFDGTSNFSGQNSQSVWIEGALREDGILVADRIVDRADQNGSLEVNTIEREGQMTDWNRNQRTFKLGVFQVIYGSDIDTSRLTIGSQVLVKGEIENNMIEANSIELVAPSLSHNTGIIDKIGASVATPERPGNFLIFKDLRGEYKLDNNTVVQDRQGNLLNLSDLQEGDIVSFSQPAFPEPVCSRLNGGGFSFGLTNAIAVGVSGGLEVQTITLEFRASDGLSGSSPIPITNIDGISAEGLLSIKSSEVALTQGARLETRTGRELKLSELSEDVTYSTRVFGRPAADNGNEFESISFVRILVSSLDCEN